MNRWPLVLLMTLAGWAPGSVVADSSIDAASTCLADSTNGRDRKLFVTWMFLAISKHPEIRSLSAADGKVEEEANRAVGELITRLMTDDCGSQLKAMIAEHGVSSIGRAFEVFGRVAMMELMSNSEVGAAISGIDRYVDNARIQAALGVN